MADQSHKPQIVPSKFAECRSLKDTIAKIGRKKKTAEEIMREAEERKQKMNDPLKERMKKWKWNKGGFQNPSRLDELKLTHWKKDTEKKDRIELFAKFNYRTPVVTYKDNNEYFAAGLDKLPSSSSWTKLETDVLMELCEKYDLRFVIVADRFV